MLAWGAIILAMIIVSASGLFYLSSRIRRFSAFRNFSRKKALFLSFLTVIFAFLVLFVTMGMMNAMVVILHFLIIWLISDLFSLIFRKITKKERHRYIAGGVAIIVTVIYLISGAFFAFHVFRTEYTVYTDKALPGDSLKIVAFSDCHMGNTVSVSDLKKYVERINGEEPDIVVIIGDFVDDNTSLEIMENSCRALSSLRPKYGTYYVFGNHDAGYYSELHNGYGAKKLTEKLRENSVTVLTDDTEIIENVAVIGRRDKRYSGRLTAEKLTVGLDENYKIVLDHQPGDYENEAAAACDLVLSGHTHGGQMIPINFVGEWIGVNDNTYGYERRGKTDFIVTSGLGGWELYFKTGCISEYAVINVERG